MPLYGAKIGAKHTYKDFGLIPKNRLVFDPPAPKTNYIYIPEADGSIDITEALTGEVHYSERKARFEFAVIEHRTRWSLTYSRIMNYLHGQKLEIRLDEDPGWYYVGRLSVNKWASDKKEGNIVIDIVADPYKYKERSSTDDWLWDPFCFETDYTDNYAHIEVSGEKTVKVRNPRMPLTPSILVNLLPTKTDDDMPGIDATVKYSGKNYPLSEGINIIPEIRIKADTTLVFTANTPIDVSIQYREGSL